MSPAIRPRPGRPDPAPRRAEGARSPAQHYRAENWRIDESIGYLMRVALSALKREVEAECEAHGMTGEQVLPLLALSQGMCNTGADLARLYDVDPGAVTRMLDRLEAKGLVERVRRADDRRVVEIVPTAAGHAMAAGLPALLAATLNRALRGFSRDEVDQFKGMLRRLSANLRPEQGEPR